MGKARRIIIAITLAGGLLGGTAAVTAAGVAPAASGAQHYVYMHA